MFNLYNSSKIKKKQQEQTNRQRKKKLAMLRLDKNGPKQTMFSLIVNDDLFFFETLRVCEDFAKDTAFSIIIEQNNLADFLTVLNIHKRNDKH